MYGISNGVAITRFKRLKDIFVDRETAKAWWFISKYNRLAKSGLPMNEIIIGADDKRSIEIATLLWPEDLV